MLSQSGYVFLSERAAEDEPGAGDAGLEGSFELQSLQTPADARGLLFPFVLNLPEEKPDRGEEGAV